MSKKLTTEKVLKKLNIEDFNCITLDKIGAFSSMLPQMDPEVAKKALEQFPEFAKTGKELISELHKTVDRILESNNKCVAQHYEGCYKILDILTEELNRENITLDEKKEIIERILEVNQMMSEIDTNNRNFMLKALGILGVATSFGFIVIGTALGNRTETYSNKE